MSDEATIDTGSVDTTSAPPPATETESQVSNTGNAAVPGGIFGGMTGDHAFAQQQQETQADAPVAEAPVKYTWENALGDDGKWSEGWSKALSPELKETLGEDYLKRMEEKYPQMESMVKNMHDMEKAIGKKGILPPDLEDIEAIQKHGQDHLGAPKEAVEYDLSSEALGLPEGYPTEHLDKQLDKAKEIGHKWGIPVPALKELADSVMEGEAAFFKDSQQLLDDTLRKYEEQAIKDIGGEQNIQAAMQQANAFVSHFMPDLKDSPRYAEITNRYPELTVELSKAFKTANMGQGSFDTKSVAGAPAKSANEEVQEWVDSKGGMAKVSANPDLMRQLSEVNLKAHKRGR